MAPLVLRAARDSSRAAKTLGTDVAPNGWTAHASRTRPKEGPRFGTGFGPRFALDRKPVEAGRGPILVENGCVQDAVGNARTTLDHLPFVRVHGRVNGTSNHLLGRNGSQVARANGWRAISCRSRSRGSFPSYLLLPTIRRLGPSGTIFSARQLMQAKRSLACSIETS